MMSQDTPNEPCEVFSYPGRFLYGEVVLFSLVSTLMIFAWIPALISLFTYGAVVASALRAAVFLNITAVALMLLFFFVKGELRATRFILTDSAIARKTSTKVQRIPFSGVTGVSLLTYPFGGGVLSIESRETTMVIPLLVQPVDLLVHKLELICSSCAIGCAVEPDLWKRVHAEARLSKFIAGRSENFFTPVLTLCISMLPFHIFTGAFFWDIGVIPLAIWTVAGPIIPLAGYAAADIVVRRMARKKTDTPLFASMPEIADTVFVRAGYITLCGYLLAAIFFKTLVL